MSPTARQLLILAAGVAAVISLRRAIVGKQAQPIIVSYKFLDGKCLEVSRDLFGRLRENPVELARCLS